jgi:hypothetical protein
MNGQVEQGIERFGGVLEGRPRPTPGCRATEEEEEEESSVYGRKYYLLFLGDVEYFVYVVTLWFFGLKDSLSTLMIYEYFLVFG